MIKSYPSPSNSSNFPKNNSDYNCIYSISPVYAPLYSATQTPPSVKSHPTNYFFFSLISQQIMFVIGARSIDATRGESFQSNSPLFLTPVTHATARDNTGMLLSADRRIICTNHRDPFSSRGRADRIIILQSPDRMEPGCYASRTTDCSRVFQINKIKS